MICVCAWTDWKLFIDFFNVNLFSLMDSLSVAMAMIVNKNFQGTESIQVWCTTL